MAEIKIGLIGGSGLGEAIAAQARGTRHEVTTPFGPPSDAIVETTLGDIPVFVLARHGPGHLLNPTQVPYRANIFAMKSLGVTHIIASGAVGSLREEYKPRDLVIPDQIIDKTHKRSATFFDRSAVHVEFSEPFCPVLRQILVETAATTINSIAPDADDNMGAEQSTAAPYKVYPRGCYVCMEGPAFSTRAESLMHRLWGGDLIGMTAMPEAKLAREAEISYALIALVTDYDCWRNSPTGKPTKSGEAAAGLPDPFVLLHEIIANLRAASDNAIHLIRGAVAKMSERAEELASAPAREALKLAIWSDKGRIPHDEVELLAPIWMKYMRETTNEQAPMTGE